MLRRLAGKFGPRLLMVMAAIGATTALVGVATGSQRPAAPDPYLPGDPSPSIPAQQPVNLSGAPPAKVLTDHLSVFGSPQAAADRLGTRNRGSMAAEYYDDQAHAAAKLDPIKGVGHTTDSDLFLAGGPNDTVCLLELTPEARGPGGTCAAAETASQGLALITQERAAPGMKGIGTGGGVDIFGVVPDGVTSVEVLLANGSTSTLPVRRNMYAATMPSATQEVTFTGPGGTRSVDAPSG